MTQGKEHRDAPKGIGTYATPRELAVEVFRHCDVAGIALSLLEHGSANGGSVRAYMWEKLVDLYFAKSEPAPKKSKKKEEKNVEIIWDILTSPNVEPQ
jgi:hypothetical protein